MVDRERMKEDEAYHEGVIDGEIHGIVKTIALVVKKLQEAKEDG